MYVKVFVHTDAKSDALHSSTDERYTVFTTAPARDNKANTRVKELIADHYKVPVSAVRIMRGHHARHKLLCIQKTTL